MQTEKMVVKTLRLPVALLDEVKRAAKKERRNLSDFARLALEDRVRKIARRKAA
jgi:hypothetical protein